MMKFQLLFLFLALVVFGAVLAHGKGKGKGKGKWKWIPKPKPKHSDTCEAGFVKNGTTCYYFSRDYASHFVADIYCMLLGAKLVTVESEEEDEFIRDHTTATYCHLGGSDLRFEGTFYWRNPRKEIEGYTNWAEGYPDNLRGNKNCMALYSPSDYKWINMACGITANFICEKPL